MRAQSDGRSHVIAPVLAKEAFAVTVVSVMLKSVHVTVPLPDTFGYWTAQVAVAVLRLRR